MAFESKEMAQAYWRENLRLMLWLSVVWFVVSYGCGVLLVEPLNAIRLGGLFLLILRWTSVLTRLATSVSVTRR